MAGWIGGGVLFLRGLRWRRSFSIAVLLVGLISAAVATVGPLYARAASESTLTDELAQARARTGLAFTAEVPARAADGAAAVARRVAAAGAVPGYGQPIRGESTVVQLRAPADPYSTTSTMVFRSGQCAHVIITHGRCPRTTGEAMVPEVTFVDAPHWRVGLETTVRQPVDGGANGIQDGPVITRVRIVGSYRPRDFTEAYWFNLPYFNAELGVSASSAVHGGIDAIFVEPGAFDHAPATVAAALSVDVPLVPGRVRLSDVPALRRNVAHLQHLFPRRAASLASPAMRTGLPGVLADAARDKRQVEAATLVVVLELSALSLLVLFRVVGAAVGARGNEIALAKLRGLAPRRTIAFALGEPVVLLAIAAPLGYLLAFGLTRAMASSALVDGTPVAVTGASGWALAAAFGGGALAAVLASVRAVTRPVLDQWRNTSPPQVGARFLLAFDVTLAALAAASVIALRVTDHSRPRSIFLFAPALLVFAAALIGVRVVARLLRRRLGRTRASRRLVSFLALRQTVRRPGGLRLAVLLAVAVGLATFAICGEAVARGNRAARAETEIGTAQRATVLFETGHDPQTIVDTVDPSKSWAMAAAIWSPDGGPPATVVGELMGVEPDRLRGAAYRVRGQLSPQRLAAAITGTAAPPVTFRGTQLRVELDTTALAGNAAPGVDLAVRRTHQQATIAHGPALRLGRHDYTVPVECADGCSFVGITIDRSVVATGPVTGRTRLQSLQVGDGSGFRALSIPLSRAASWRTGELGLGSQLRVASAGTALSLTFRSTDGSSPVLTYADSPALLPIAATPKSTNTPDAIGGVTDYSDTTVPYRVSTRAQPLPAMLDTGAIADLDYLRQRLPNFDRESTWTVWIGPHAPADALARLKRAGLLVQHVDTAGRRVAQLSRQGPALGLLLLLVCAVAAAVLAIGGTAVTLLGESRRRLFEFAALRMVGVPRRTLRRSAVAEQVLLLGAAVVLGLPSGFVAAALVLPVVPEFSDSTPVVLRYSPPVLLAVACAAAFAVLLGITALVAGQLFARAATAGRLRESAT